jgi:hypothetical protein
VGIVGGHDSERDFNALVTEFLLKGQNVVAVVVHESFPSEELEGNGNLDTRVTKPFTETTCYEDKCSVVEFLEPDFLVMFDDVRFVETKVDTVGFADVVIFIRVD